MCRTYTNYYNCLSQIRQDSDVTGESVISLTVNMLMCSPLAKSGYQRKQSYRNKYFKRTSKNDYGCVLLKWHTQSLRDWGWLKRRILKIERYYESSRKCVPIDVEISATETNRKTGDRMNLIGSEWGKGGKREWIIPKVLAQTVIGAKSYAGTRQMPRCPAQTANKCVRGRPPITYALWLTHAQGCVAEGPKRSHHRFLTQSPKHQTGFLFENPLYSRRVVSSILCYIKRQVTIRKSRLKIKP